MRISDWSSDVCSSDLAFRRGDGVEHDDVRFPRHALGDMAKHPGFADAGIATNLYKPVLIQRGIDFGDDVEPRQMHSCESVADIGKRETGHLFQSFRSEEHMSELQSLMRNSYAVFCLKKTQHNTIIYHE